MKIKVLLTGGTGLIGGELIIALNSLGGHVTVVTRIGPNWSREHVINRLEKSVRWKPEYANLISSIIGDQSQPNFYLPESVIEENDVFIHCAANTSFKPWVGVYEENLTSASYFADTLRTRPTIKGFFISTAAVNMTQGVVTEEMPCFGYSNEYTRSKRDAESLLCAIKNITILRPGIVLPRGINDSTLSKNMLWTIPVIASLGDVPLEKTAKLDITPVDFVAEAIAKLVTKDTLKYPIYHISTGVASVDLQTIFGSLAQLQGEKFKSLAPRKNLLLKAITPYLPFLNSDTVFAADRLLDETGILAPSPGSYLLEMLNA